MGFVVLLLRVVVEVFRAAAPDDDDRITAAPSKDEARSGISIPGLSRSLDGMILMAHTPSVLTYFEARNLLAVSPTFAV